MPLYGNHRLLVGLGALALLIGTIVFWVCESIDQPAPTMVPRARRAEPQKDKCLQQYGGFELNYTKGSTTSFKFDLCDVIPCGRSKSSWRGYDVYLCGLGWPGNQRWCPSWGHVWQATNRDFNPVTRTADGKLKTAGHFAIQRDYSTISNPVTLSMIELQQNPYSARPSGGCWDPKEKSFYVLLGVDVSGKDPMALLKVNLIEIPAPPSGNSTEGNKTESTDQTPPMSPEVTTLDYSQLQPSEVIQMATGYADDNLWLNWVARSAKEQKMGDCVACASARPHLVTVPAPLFPDEDATGYNCMVRLTKGRSQNCTTLASLFPPIRNDTITGPFTPDKANGSYVCFNFTTARCGSNHNPATRNISIGNLDPSWCNITKPGEDLGTWARAGLYYYCGRRRLLMRIKPHMYGTCAMVRLRTPLMLIGNRLTTAQDSRESNAALTRHRRRHVLAKRSASGFDLSVNSPTYLDAIGVPRGVPNEFKLADQVASGFENIPIVSALFPVTPNKNVDRINYVHYNVLRLANLTRDAIEGLADQLAPTSLMAVQNRMALDMLLAEKGGVCAMFGDMCCTFIPNNMAPDGSVTKALEGLRTLSKTMHDHSGINNPLEDWMAGMFGQWKGVIMSLLISITIFIAILVTCGCCCIPCLRSLSLRLITTAIEGREAQMMPLLESHRQGAEDEDPEWTQMMSIDL